MFLLRRVQDNCRENSRKLPPYRQVMSIKCSTMVRQCYRRETYIKSHYSVDRPTTVGASVSPCGQLHAREGPMSNFNIFPSHPLSTKSMSIKIEEKSVPFVQVKKGKKEKRRGDCAT